MKTTPAREASNEFEFRILRSLVIAALDRLDPIVLGNPAKTKIRDALITAKRGLDELLSE